MINPPCPDYRDKLIEYADEALSQDETAYVAEHIQTCPVCQQWLDALRQSMAITQGVWQTGYEPVESVSIPSCPRNRHRLVRNLVAVAASVVVMLAGWWIVDKPPQSDLTVTQIEQQIQEAEHVGSQLVVAQILASCDGTEDMVKRHSQYMETMYPEAYRILNVK